MNSIIKFKNLNLLLLYFLPISIILGQFELNLTIFLITLVFLIELLIYKKNNFYKDEIFLCFLFFSIFAFLT